MRTGAALCALEGRMGPASWLRTRTPFHLGFVARSLEDMRTVMERAAARRGQVPRLCRVAAAVVASRNG